MRIAIVSDTHGLVRPSLEAFLRGADHIVHAGDIGGAAVLERLAAFAPTTAVRGNNDHGDWADTLPEHTGLALGGLRLHLLHDLASLAIDPAAERIDIVVCGHSHRPAIVAHAGWRLVNPGSAGPRRFRLPVSAAELQLQDGRAELRLVELDDDR